MITVTDLVESFNSPLREAEIQEHGDKIVIKNVCVLGERSANGRSYPSSTQAASFKSFEGAKCYLNHGIKHSTDARDLRDLIGRHNSLRVRGNRPFSDLNLIANRLVKETVLPAIRSDSSIAGCSIVAKGKLNSTTGIVEAITSVRSIDLVTEPATTQGLLESVDRKTLPRDNAAVLALIEGSRFIPAENKLGIYKRCAGMSLNDSKIFVEAIEQSLRIVARQKPTRPINNPEKFLNTLLRDEQVSQNYSRWANLLRR